MRLLSLTTGDRIRIAAPAGPFRTKPFRRGVRALQTKGFEVVFRSDIFSNHRHFAGDDKRRLLELRQALADPKTKALLFARGGYGTARLLPGLNHQEISPKIVVGLSDLTILLGYLWKKYSLPSFYGPLVAPHLGNRANATRLTRALTNPLFFSQQKIVARATIGRRHRAQGTLIGGCLSLIVATLGTPYEWQTTGKILFLEDTNEEAYAVDRMLTQLKQAGKFKGVKGIVFGTFRLKGVLFPAKIKEAVHDCLQNFSGPILWGVPFGHCPEPLIMPFGAPARIQGKKLIITKGILR